VAYLKDKKLLKNTAYLLKQLREEKELTQADVFNDIKIHIGRIETAKSDIQLSTLSVLCKYYDISLSDFFVKVENL